MDFFIQTGNPYSSNIMEVNDKKLSEAIESVFPMNTENLILFWKHIGIPLSYKYDISYMIDDILMLLQRIQSESKGEVSIHWLPDTFRADWKVSWKEEVILIEATWENLVGDLQKLLTDAKTVEITKEEFLSEWKMLLEVVMKALKNAGYHQQMEEEYEKLAKIFCGIGRYGVLYQHTGN